jgi:hypothetical protein
MSNQPNWRGEDGAAVNRWCRELSPIKRLAAARMEVSLHKVFTNRSKLLLVLLVAGLLSVHCPVVFGARGGGRAGGVGGAEESPADPGLPGLSLQHQRLFQWTLQNTADKLRALEEKLAAAQRAMLASALASPSDQKAVKSQAEVVAGLQAEISVLRAKALSAVAQTMLPAAQRQFAATPDAASILSGEPAGGDVLAPAGGPAAGAPAPGLATSGRVTGVSANPSSQQVALTADQQQLFQQALQKDAAHLRNMSANLRSALNDLVIAAVVADNKESLQEKAAAVTGVQVGMGAIRLEALAAVAQKMSPEQRQQLVESPVLFQALCEGNAPFGAATAGGRGGRGGGVLGAGRDPLPKER